MTTQQLPERPNLEQLKRQAKDLLHSATSNVPTVQLASRTRFRALPAFAQKTDDELARTTFALHDAQSVVAREHGFLSWAALRERVEELTLQFAEAVDEFVRAATDGRSTRAERLLALHPRIAKANFHTALVLGDAAAVEARLAEKPGRATEAGGPRGWEPLLYVCHTSLHHGAHARPEGLVAIARRLIALGADPNARFPWLHHGVRRPVLWGALCVVHVRPLAKALLEAGANPNDGVTIPLAAASSDLPALELLRAHGGDANCPWATDGSPSLYAILGWAGKPDGARWLVEHGADVNRVAGGNGETPLHAAARKWDATLVEFLVRHGADVTRRRADGRTPYAVAELNGNRAAADWLLAHGASGELSEVDRFAAACNRGERATAAAMLATRPGLSAELGADHYAALRQAADRGDTKALETMLDHGFDPNVADDEMGSTALHRAAMEGWPEIVRVLLAHGASVTVRDKEFHAQPLIWAAEGSRAPRRAGRDHAAVARLLLDAGSSVDWETGDEPAEAILEILSEWRRT
jgi:ankyrin repeat protein